MGWRLGLSTGTARSITTIADRIEEFPRCVAGMGEGRLSLDQVAVIAARAAEGCDEHYAALAAVATVSQYAPRSSSNRARGLTRCRCRRHRSPRPLLMSSARSIGSPCPLIGPP